MAITPWIAFCRHCLLSRVTPVQFERLLKQRVSSQSDGKRIFNGFLECRHSMCPSTDPLPPRYLAVLLSGTVSLLDALVILVNRWNRATGSLNLPESDLVVLQELTLFLVSSRLALDEAPTERCLLLVSRWLVSLIDLKPDSKTFPQPLLESLGMLLSAVAASNSGIAILSQKDTNPASKRARVVGSVRKAVDAALTLFSMLSDQLVERLGAVQKHISIFSAPPENTPQADIQALQFQNNIAELPMAASRAGTVTYLENMLFTAKTIDDGILFNFLAGRHSNDFLSMFGDVLLASFQVLKRSLENFLPFQQTEFFIRNKLPTVLSTISASSFGSIASEQALTEAWQQIQLASEPESTCAQHFLHVCSLHHLISDEAAQQLIGPHDQTFSKGLYSKEDLSHHSKATKLIEELTKADGSAGPISQAIVEMMLGYSQNKETHHLKDLANSILKRPAAINALALFVRPSVWLSPLCAMLDEWKWDDIHGESQPVYEEFGAIFLLILATKRRLCLSSSDLGIAKGFMARYLDQEGVESDGSQNHLGDWINALYVAEGLSDELTTSCSPQEFYLLVPTLLRQSVLAHQRGRLSQDALKGGLEYLLEPFLLPSLVSAMAWVNNLSDASVEAMVSSVLSAPSNDAREVHSTIMTMMQSPTEFCFAWNLEMTPDDLEKRASAISESSLSVDHMVQTFGSGAVIESLLNVLLQFSGTSQFLLVLDILATLVCVSSRELRDLLRLKFIGLGSLLKRNEAARAETLVYLHRRVESYASVLVVPDTGMEFVFGKDATNANLDSTQNQEPSEEQAMDDIDLVLNESANAGTIEQGDDTGLGMDDLYGLQSDSMGLEDLDNLDLDMFG